MRKLVRRLFDRLVVTPEIKRLRVTIRDKDQLISWQKKRNDRVISEATKQRAETFAILSRARGFCPPNLQSDIDAMIKASIPQAARPRADIVIPLPAIPKRSGADAYIAEAGWPALGSDMKGAPR